MMDTLKKNMPIVLGILVVILGLVVYLNFFSGNSSEALLASSADTNSPVSQELLTVLTNLHTIRLDNSIFSSPAFQSLTSFGVELPPEAVGRRNPFLPIGSQ
jgi:hypothetical protein